MAVVAAGAFVFGLDPDLPALRLLVKPIPVLCLIAWTYPWTTAPSRALVAGLALSLLGDVFLEVDQFLPGATGPWFVAGLGAFLCGHVAYAYGFMLRAPRPHAARLVPCALFAVGYLAFVWDGLGPLRLPVVAYLLVIMTMLWRAACLAGESRLALLGAMLFVASDSLIGLDRFHGAFPGVRYAIILLYWLGQWGIAASLRDRGEPGTVPTP